ncbi:MAG: hypothetical protein HY658_05980 [Actinobacteria bacterium]|nr:hypothetical protein [Actinomycetota bacterium]
MKATRPGHQPPPSPTNSSGRVCAHEGCATRLSVYNPRRHCWQHTELVFPNYRGKRLSPGKA